MAWCLVHCCCCLNNISIFFQKVIVDVRSLQTAALLPWQPEVL